MTATNRSISSSLVPAISRRQSTGAPSLLSAILSQWPLIWARGAPSDASSLPEYLRRDIGLPPAVPQRDFREFR